MCPTKREIYELIQNEPESLHENEPTSNDEESSPRNTDGGLDSSETTLLDNPSDIMIIEELVYPYEMTVDMLAQYRKFSSLNLDKDLTRIFRKLYRSARYWRIGAKQYAWLIKQMR